MANRAVMRSSQISAGATQRSSLSGTDAAAAVARASRRCDSVDHVASMMTDSPNDNSSAARLSDSL